MLSDVTVRKSRLLPYLCTVIPATCLCSKLFELILTSSVGIGLVVFLNILPAFYAMDVFVTQGVCWQRQCNVEIEPFLKMANVLFSLGAQSSEKNLKMNTREPKNKFQMIKTKQAP